MGTESVEKACRDRYLGFKIHISIWFPLNGLVLAGDCVLAVSEISNRSSQRPLTGKMPGQTSMIAAESTENFLIFRLYPTIA